MPAALPLAAGPLPAPAAPALLLDRWLLDLRLLPAAVLLDRWHRAARPALDRAHPAAVLDRGPPPAAAVHLDDADLAATWHRLDLRPAAVLLALDLRLPTVDHPGAEDIQAPVPALDREIDRAIEGEAPARLGFDRDLDRRPPAAVLALDLRDHEVSRDLDHRHPAAVLAFERDHRRCRLGLLLGDWA